MQPWFVWKGKNSFSDFGLWVNRLPPVVRAKERYEEIIIPGRSGSLIMTEGDDVYDSYVKECVVIAPNTRNIQPILDWLRGSGDVIFSNEISKAYEARIAAEVSFERVGNNLIQATIPFFVKPFKHNVNEQEDAVTITGSSGSIYNPGDVASKPKITITNSGSSANNTISIGNKQMLFMAVTGTIVVDCEANIITQGGSLWAGNYAGDFITIPKGANAVAQTGTMSITIEPRWRWV